MKYTVQDTVSLYSIEIRKMRLSAIFPFILVLLGVAPANAASLYWKKVVGVSFSYDRCMQNAARNNGLREIRRSNLEVAGTSIDGSVYVSITCIPREGNERAVMMIMGVGDNFEFTKSIVNSTADTVRTNRGPEDTF